MFGENSSYVIIFLYLNWTEATKIETIMKSNETVHDKCSLDIVLKEIA
jgi:hypothetical protein